MQKLLQCLFFLSLSCFCSFPSLAFSRNPNRQFSQANNYEGSSDLVDLRYHMGPVLASPINLYIIWYGHWNPTHQSTIRDFIYSLSSPAPYPSVADWWRTVRFYTDQTGSNITGNIVLSGEFYDSMYSHGSYLSRLAIQSAINSAVTTSKPRALPLNPHNGLYLVLTSSDVRVQDFCRAVCGFHYFSFPTIVGVTVPYAWVGYSGSQCPGMCAYPFAWPDYSKMPPPGAGGVGGGNVMRPPNGDPGVDGMISVIAHELAEVSSNPLVNAWYAGEDPTAPTEIADLCMGVYGTGGGGGYVGKVYRGTWGVGYNVNGVKGRKFMVQWVWNPVTRRCFGPNALD
ncbi:Phosphate-induced protein [Parasponia andersonii]|uniref:Phosphate-induced protein n=1 Tax=Parasponia andersonii TaxID=3476 RepID=A0A2P5DWU5_PARAD|nr:Phosphate-induced protein [Parasponia andersonii]